MALPTASNPDAPSAQVVGNAFVEQYYRILHTSPELVHRFYQDSSVLSRPDANDVMTSVTTMQGINEKILSLNFKECKAEIKTADAQKSYNDGVTVLVTGCFTGTDNMKRKFAQSFFLAPQNNGYFVLNDVFRYVEDSESLENQPVYGIDNNTTVPSILDSEPSHVPDPSAPDPGPSVVEEHKNLPENTGDYLDHETQLVNDKEIIVEDPSHSDENDDSTVVESPSTTVQQDAPKKSYASIVKVLKGSSVPTKAYVPADTKKGAPKEIEHQSAKLIAPVPDPEMSGQSSNNNPETSGTQEEVEGHSIYIRNLPFNLTVSQLKAEFKKFGPIKEGGVQVRYNKQQGYCFGFVEFRALNSVHAALQASPVTIGGRQANVEIKRTTTRVNSGRGRFSSGRAGFRNDSFRARGNNGGGWGFYASDGSRGEFSGRSRSSSSRGEGHWQGRVRGGPSSGVK